MSRSLARRSSWLVSLALLITPFAHGAGVDLAPLAQGASVDKLSKKTQFFMQGGNAFGATAKLGTTDTFPLEIYVANARALHIQPDATSPILIAGSNANTVTAGASGAAIGGGGAAGTQLVVGGMTFFCVDACANRVTDAFGTIGGGLANQAGDNAGTLTDHTLATVGGGFDNMASGGVSTVAGGHLNTASGSLSFVAGRFANTASGARKAPSPGGDANTASGR